MSGFDPGEGWREVEPSSPAVNDALDLLVRWRDGLPTYWVPADPMPPLPTEPYTVIRVTWDPKQTGYAGHVLVRLPEGSYHDWSFGGDEGDGFGSTEQLRREIVSFEVLAEPRAVTAGAFRNRVREVYNDIQDGRTLNETLAIVAEEFGVTS